MTEHRTCEWAPQRRWTKPEHVGEIFSSVLMTREVQSDTTIVVQGNNAGSEDSTALVAVRGIVRRDSLFALLHERQYLCPRVIIVQHLSLTLRFESVHRARPGEP